jgi:PIN domain nuclease of toxin-antitoxin system
VSFLLDTNALLWWLAGSDRVTERAREVIEDPRQDVYVSAASAWEIAIKVGIGKLAVPADVATWLPVELEHNRFQPLPISLRHAVAIEALPRHHADPFDRMLIAQAIAEGMTIITGDETFTAYDVRTILL